MKEYFIIGAGIQGCCIALELAANGKKVTLLERDREIFNRSSLRNEGKIHLGLVYMNDPTFETPCLMLEGALLFRKSLERWIGKKSYELGLSSPFYYLVANDSFLTADQLENGYQRLEKKFNEFKQSNPDWDYLGQHPEKLFERKSSEEIHHHFNKEKVQGGFLTSELAINTVLLRNHLVSAIQENENISVITETSVENISNTSQGFFLTLNSPSGIHSKHCEIIINCAWDGKYRLDQQMNLQPPKNISHRLKYRVIVSLPEEFMMKPSATMVIGKYGDVVNQKNGMAYLSWYPSACKDWSFQISPPKEWELPAQGIIDQKVFDKLSKEFLYEIEKWYPGISSSSPLLVDAGSIVAIGNTDVNDPLSTLHTRSQLGFRQNGNYYSIETGKLTTAPMIAVSFVKSILQL